MKNPFGIYTGNRSNFGMFNPDKLLLAGTGAAYSLRQLSTTYTGNAIRVRRALDNTEQNIGFVDG